MVVPSRKITLAAGSSGPLAAASSVRRFRRTVYAYFSRHGRRLPWRRDTLPYHIFVSEVMLQQTQVDRVALKFDPFIREFPSFGALARAPLAKVLRLWQGLGYNRRALSLKRAAEIVMREHGGRLPRAPEALATLPGIGTATSASIAAFAFNSPAVFLETNIRSVLIHHFFHGRSGVRDEQLLPLAERLLDRKNPCRWYSALMDYGTMLKKRCGNASRRSAHYATQSRFEGSTRQKRGKIVRLLLGRKPLSADSIARLLRLPPRTAAAVLDGLAADRIVAASGGRYRIA